MASVFAAYRPSALSRLGARRYTLLGILALIILAFPVFLRQSQDWESVYVPAAERLTRGEDIFQKAFVYPPINAWLAIPFVDLPRLPARTLWYAINMASLGVLVLGAWKLSGGGRLDGEPARREQWIFWLGLGCGISSCLDAITNQQTDLIVAALVILGCLALVGQHTLWAGVWFGIAAAIKCTPLLWAPYLMWHKRWAAGVLIIVTAIGVNLIPDLTYPHDGPTRIGDWTVRYLLPMAERDHEVGSWACGIGGNQSVAGLTRRWLAYDTLWNGSHLMGVRSAAPAAPWLLNGAAGGSMLLLLAAALVCAWKAPAGMNADRRSNGPISTETGLQFGMVLILMVLLSPHSSKPHFCTLLLPGFCVARAALNWPNRGLLALLLAALACAAVSNADLVGEWLYSWGKWYGSLAWCALLLYVGSCGVLLRRNR